MVVILTYGLDSSFLLGREEKNGYTEECSFFFLFFPLFLSVELSGLREQRNQRQQKNEFPKQFPITPIKKHTQNRCQKTRRLEVL